MKTKESRVTRTTLSIAALVPDPRNRRIVEDEELESLTDSIRVLGLLQPLHVRPLADGMFQLIDGERRWRAAMQLGLKEIPCDVWSAEANSREIVLAALVLNEQRRAHGCLDVARRLRDIKNEHGLSHEELATQTGLPLDRVKSYFSMFGASDFVLTFCETHDLPLKVGVEIVRYERATNEACARRLATRYLESPLSAKEIAALRKRDEKRGRDERPQEATSSRASASARALARVEAELRKDRERTLGELATFVETLGFRLVPIAAGGGR